MDNLSDNEELNTDSGSPAKQTGKDIQFEEVFDIDKIQKELESSTLDIPANTENLAEKLSRTASETERKALKNLKLKEANVKKYVIYVDSDNIDYMESLSLDERKKVINDILKEQSKLSVKEREIAHRNKYFRHAMIACITFIIFFPLMFILVNKALMATITNYQQARENFARLYKEQGKIKMESR